MKLKWIWVSTGLLAATLGFVAGRQSVPVPEPNHSRSLKTMNEIQGIGRLKIRDGKLEEFKRVASQFMQVARAKDTGTLQYELYFNEDQTECIVLERYRDVQSLLEHQHNVGGLMDSLLKTCTGSSEVCATATPELLKALNGSPVRLFTPYQTL
jgi:quinol monooxygenase YgiN